MEMASLDDRLVTDAFCLKISDCRPHIRRGHPMTDEAVNPLRRRLR